MARSAKHVHKACSVILLKFLRFFCFGRKSLRSSSYVRRGMLRGTNRTSQFILNADIGEKTAHIVKEAFDIKKQKSFVAPRLDKSRLIIEELKMGFVGNHHIKAKFGSKVRVNCEYKSEGGDSIEKLTCNLILGRSQLMRALHDGICGMSLGDKRRLHIPFSQQSGQRAICEVTLLQVH